MQPASLMKHSIRFHAEEKKSEYFIVCPLCPTKVRFQEALVNHCRDVHEDEECIVQTEIFKSVKEYETWKESVAKAYCTAWLNVGEHGILPTEITYYRCSRVHSTRRRAKKLLPGTQYGYCTSFLNEYVYDDGTVFVKFCVRHISHDVSAASLPLTKKDRDIIASYLKLNVDEDSVRDLIREDYNDPSTRLYWIRPADIRRAMSSLAWQKRKQREAGSTTFRKSATDDAAERSSSPCSIYDDPFIPSVGDSEEPSSSTACTADKPSPSCNVYDDPFIPSAEDLAGLSRSHDETADSLLSSCSAYEEPHDLLETADKLLPICDIPDDPSISAVTLMEEASAAMNEDGRSYNEHKTGANSVSSTEPSSSVLPAESVVPGESLLGCPSCAKLKKRVAELQVTVDNLKKKLPRVEEPVLFDNMVVKEEIS
ncbi:hypothetical protein OSTOST_22055 [Ostertagia ostertagi]